MCLSHTELNSLNLYTSGGLMGGGTYMSICKIWLLSQYPLTFVIEQHSPYLFFFYVVRILTLNSQAFLSRKPVVCGLNLFTPGSILTGSLSPSYALSCEIEAAADASATSAQASEGSMVKKAQPVSTILGSWGPRGPHQSGRGGGYPTKFPYARSLTC